jgi:hypothetical protein
MIILRVIKSYLDQYIGHLSVLLRTGGGYVENKQVVLLRAATNLNMSVSVL